MRPQNVLVGPDGPVMLVWDNAGPVSAERELARAYRDAGGRAVIKNLEAFSMLFATDLNYVYVQADCAVDPARTAEQRGFGSHGLAAVVAYRHCRPWAPLGTPD